MYAIHDYGDMLADRGRMAAYARALNARVTTDSVVLDIGAGTGALTLLACQAGARRVISVEPDGIIETARDMVRVNGFSDRVEFVQAEMATIALREPVDVIVADIHGVLPFFRASPSIILEARDRFLRPGGSVIPLMETVVACIINFPAAHQRIVAPWEKLAGIEGEPGRLRAVNAWTKVFCPVTSLVVEPAAWTVIDYSQRDGPRSQGTLTWRVPESCQAHGLCLWFDCQTAPGVMISNSPRSPDVHVFGQAFFPWPRACDLAAGDEVIAEIRADLVGDDYLWNWETTIRAANGQSVKAHFAQHQFTSVPISKDWLKKSASAFMPSPNRAAAIDKSILDQLVAGTRLEDIARHVSAQFPDRYPTWRDALTRVGELSMRYSD